MAVETPAPAVGTIAEANAALKLRLPFADREDFDDARGGWIVRRGGGARSALSQGARRSSAGASPAATASIAGW